MTKDSLIDSLIHDGFLKTPAIIEAFKAVDRKDFVPEEIKSKAYENHALPIGYEQTISQPLTVAFMLELLEPQIGEKILDVGAGSGWQTTLLAWIVSGSKEKNKTQNEQSIKKTRRKKTEKIIAIERIPELRSMAAINVSRYNFIKKRVVEIVLSDGAKGYEIEMPFDKIIAAATARGKIPEAWKEQIKIGGKIVAPVDQSVVVIEKTGPKSFIEKVFFGFSFVPLVTDEK